MIGRANISAAWGIGAAAAVACIMLAHPGVSSATGSHGNYGSEEYASDGHAYNKSYDRKHRWHRHGAVDVQDEDEWCSCDQPEVDADDNEQHADPVNNNSCTNDEPTDNSTDEPTDEPADEPSDQPSDNPSDQPTQKPLELSVDQQVKVGDGDFVDAETDNTAATGTVGDTATWQITVKPDEVAQDESRTIKVNWTAPDNVEVTGSMTTAGSYNGTAWTVPITSLPATMTVTTTIKGSGLGAAQAVISDISCDDPAAVDGYCAFSDGNVVNNTNPAGIIASSAVTPTSTPGTSNPGVLGDSTSVPNAQGGEGVVAGTTTTRTNGRVLAWDANYTHGQVNGDSVLAATGINIIGTFIIGGLLAIIPFLLRVRE